MSRSHRPPRAAARRTTHSRFDEHRSERREQLLDAATQVVRRLGADTTMEAIAAEVGVAKPVLYRYFGDRTGLFEALADRFATRLVTTLSEALALGLPPREQVAASIDAYVGVLVDDPQVYRFATMRMRSAAAGSGGVLDAATAMLARPLGEALRAADRDSGAAEVWAAGIVGMVHVATDRWLGRQLISRTALVEYLSELLWSGLGAASTSRTAEAAS